MGRGQQVLLHRPGVSFFHRPTAATKRRVHPPEDAQAHSAGSSLAASPPRATRLPAWVPDTLSWQPGTLGRPATPSPDLPPLLRTTAGVTPVGRHASSAIDEQAAALPGTPAGSQAAPRLLQPHTSRGTPKPACCSTTLPGKADITLSAPALLADERSP